ncbi:M15 family metallopeptidase [Devosia sp. 2618]|uniref:M15 family metallopeptidase n=1 Tax=Devosia sp. 2618 TaxID=3156454 RepID=UPI003399D155
MQNRSIVLAVTLAIAASPAFANETGLPDGFVHLRDVAPEISQHIRYAGEHNFVGRPITGYDAAECILTRESADALAAASADLVSLGLNLRVYDCYRPARAVADFVAWASDLADLTMQAEFYPRVDKSRLFELGYIAERSGHSRGSTVDLTIEALGEIPRLGWQSGDPLVDCASPERFDDGVLEFGTGYDCFDDRAHHGASGISAEATANRQQLSDLLVRHGFKPYAEEWWHYTLASEPFPDTYFDFPITSP